MRRHGRYSNDDVVLVLRRLADDIDEPGGGEWDSEGIRSAVITYLERLDTERTTQD